MILDAKEQWYTLENLEKVEHLQLLPIDADAIENGKRCLEIPEGVKSISEDAAAVYNIGSIVSNISYILDHRELQRIEWEKKLRQRRLIKMTFPKEAGATASERSAYLVGKELRVRLVKMHLPASLESVSAAAFPRFLEAIEVDEGNAQYASVDGVLFSKDLKKLIRYPGYAGDQYSIPEGTECIAQEAFSGCYLKKLTLPASIKTIERNAFRGMSGLEEMDCQSEDIALGTGLFSESKLDQIDWWPWDSITKAAFMNSSIEHIRIPERVEAIEDYAFAGCRYVREITVSEGVKSIERNSFRLGMGFDGNVFLPLHLYPMIYRFPPLTTINGMPKRKISERYLSGENCREDREVMIEQQLELETALGKLNFMNIAARRYIQAELQCLNSMI